MHDCSTHKHRRYQWKDTELYCLHCRNAIQSVSNHIDRITTATLFIWWKENLPRKHTRTQSYLLTVSRLIVQFRNSPTKWKNQKITGSSRRKTERERELEWERVREKWFGFTSSVRLLWKRSGSRRRRCRRWSQFVYIYIERTKQQQQQMKKLKEVRKINTYKQLIWLACDRFFFFL